MTGTPRAILPRDTASARNYATPSTLLPIIPVRGPAREAAPVVTSSRDFPSAWSTGCAATKSKSLPWPMVDDGRVTGDHASDAPSNVPREPPARRAAADPARSATPLYR